MRDASALGATFGAPNHEMSAEEGPRSPGDLGFSSLGLFMSYGGGLFASLWACVGLLAAFSGTLRGMGLAMGVVAMTGLVRSIWSMGVGARLSSGDPEAGSAVRRYVVVALLQSMLAAVVCVLGIPKPYALPIAGTVFLLLTAWPVTLVGVVARRDARRAFADARAALTPLRSRNLGIEGAGALMVLFGSVGVVLALVVGYVVLVASTPAWLTILAGVTILSLLVRAILHVRAGLIAFAVSSQTTGSGGGRVERFEAGVRQYAAAAYVSIGTTSLLALVTAAKLSPQIFIVPLVIGGPLIGWPVIVSKFGGSLRMWVGDAEAERAFGPAEDGGLTAIGFVLLATSGVALASELSRWVIDMPVAVGGLQSFGFGADYAPAWMKVGALVLALVAGFGLSRTTAWSRVAALAYGFGGLGAALWSAVRLMDVLGGATARVGLDGKLALVIASGALSLVLPVSTLVLTLRNRAARS